MGGAALAACAPGSGARILGLAGQGQRREQGGQGPALPALTEASLAHNRYWVWTENVAPASTTLPSPALADIKGRPRWKMHSFAAKGDRPRCKAFPDSEMRREQGSSQDIRGWTRSRPLLRRLTCALGRRTQRLGRSGAARATSTKCEPTNARARNGAPCLRYSRTFSRRRACPVGDDGCERDRVFDPCDRLTSNSTLAYILSS